MNRLTPIVYLSAAVVVAASAVVGARAKADDATSTPITVAVTSKDGFPVRGLTASDFAVIEDGQPRAITSVRAVTEGDAATSGRTIVLVLGGPGTDPERTADIQQIARAFLSRAGRADRVSVVRFGKASDELTAAPQEHQMRVAEFRTISPPQLYAKTQEDVLDELARIAGELEHEDGARKAVVWIGAASVFDVIEPALKQHERLWPYWAKAISATARSQVSTYVVDPHGLTGRVRLSPDGLVAHTGGAIFDNTNGFEAAVDRIWNELGSHYVVEYEGATNSRDVHTIEVKVSRADVEVRGRQSR